MMTTRTSPYQMRKKEGAGKERKERKIDLQNYTKRPLVTKISLSDQDY